MYQQEENQTIQNGNNPHLLTPGQEASEGVPSWRKIRNNWSISESPGKRGCRFTFNEFSKSRYISNDYHFDKNAAQAPCVHSSGVELGAKENLRSSFKRRNLLNKIIPWTLPVPEGYHFVSITSHRYTEGPGQPEVGQLDLALGIHQQVLRLQIPGGHQCQQRTLVLLGTCAIPGFGGNSWFPLEAAADRTSPYECSPTGWFFWLVHPKND